MEKKRWRGGRGGKPTSIPEQWFFKCVIKLKEQHWNNNIWIIPFAVQRESELTLKRLRVSSSSMESNKSESKATKIKNGFWNLRLSNLLFAAQTIFFA